MRIMPSASAALIAVFVAAGAVSACAQESEPYFPPPGTEWETIAPEDAGFDPAALQAAIDFAVEHETRFDWDTEGAFDARDLALVQSINRAGEPLNSPIGPIEPRGAPTGIILRHGRIVAEWGEPFEVDMTFSVSKTFLSHTVGLAVDDGLIANVHDRAGDYVPYLFEHPHNAPITWDQLLRQTSGWSGTLFGKPDWADRPGDEPWADLAAGPPAPGAHWEYNDTRVNLLALAALEVWRRPLPDILRTRIMDPIGASDTWHWEGYENSYVEIDGEQIQSISGGGHWGGGMFISARDQARFGLLGLHRGNWNGTQLLSDAWYAASLTPTDQQPYYGYMNFFLGHVYPRGTHAPEGSWMYLGAGTNMIFIDPTHDIVAVVRWIDYRQQDEFIRLLMTAIEE